MILIIIIILRELVILNIEVIQVFRLQALPDIREILARIKSSKKMAESVQALHVFVNLCGHKQMVMTNGEVVVVDTITVMMMTVMISNVQQILYSMCPSPLHISSVVHKLELMQVLFV